MKLISDLVDIEEGLKQQASQKELYFYHKLIGKPLPYPGEKELTNEEKVYLSAFCNHSPLYPDLVQQIQRSKPYKGLHYTNNLIELLALFIHNCNYEVDNLRSFYSTASVRDCFIVHHIFPNTWVNNKTPENSIDIIALWVMDDEFPDTWELTFLDALKSAHDLIDIFVVQVAYLKIWHGHTSSEIRRDLRDLGSKTDKIIRYLKNRSDQIYDVKLAILLLPTLCISSIFIFKFWDIFEPLTFIFIEILLLALGWFGLRISISKTIQRDKDLIFNKIIQKMGISLKEIEKIIDKYKDLE